MQQFFDTLQDVNGNALTNGSIVVTAFPGGGPAIVYSDNGLTPTSSTINADATGQVSFYAPDADYIITYRKAGTVYKTRSPVALFDGPAQVTVQDSGAVNAYAIVGSQLEKALRVGLRASVKIAVTNTAASTFSYNGLAAKNITYSGASLSAGSLLAGIIYSLEFDGSGWQLHNSSSSLFAVGNVRFYGAVGNGVADDTAAITAALAAHAGAGIYIPGGTYKITSQIVVPAGTLVYGDGMGVSTLAATNCNANQLVLAGDKVTLRDFSVTVSGVGTTSQVAAVNVQNGNGCRVNRIEISGASWGGIGLFGTSSYNIVSECYCHDWQGGVQDSADVVLSYLTGPTNNNIISNNILNGGGEVGVEILGNVAVANSNPQGNLITGNRVGKHTTYGLLDYRQTDSDGFNQFIDNLVENIQGVTRPGGGVHGTFQGTLVNGNAVISGVTVPGDILVGHKLYDPAGAIPAGTTVAIIGANSITMSAPATTTVAVAETVTYFSASASGAGIYIVGCGGPLVKGNTLRNCCVQTTFRSLVPAYIAININATAPANVVGNILDGVANWDGICISSSRASVTGNTVRMLNNSTGDAAINVIASSSVQVEANPIYLPASGTTTAAIVSNQSTAQSNVTISNNPITGGNYISIKVFGAAALTGLACNGNNISGSGGGNDAMNISSVTGAVINANQVRLPTNKALVLTDVTGARVAGNLLSSTGTNSLATAGTCTGTYIDKTNSVTGPILNQGTGSIVEQLGNAVPGSGNAQVGDRVEQSVPVVGQPKGWRCTVAGAPGTWVSEGNL